MKAWVLIHQYSEHGEAGFVDSVYATEAGAEAARCARIRELVGLGLTPYHNPETDETNDEWDEDYVVEGHETVYS